MVICDAESRRGEEVELSTELSAQALMALSTGCMDLCRHLPAPGVHGLSCCKHSGSGSH